MTRPQPNQRSVAEESPLQRDVDSGDQDIDTAGVDSNPLGQEGAAAQPSLTALLVAELDREVDRTRRALERVPADRAQWKPHERSMDFGALSHMVATIPSWVAMIVNKDELDVAPVAGPAMRQGVPPTSGALLRALDAAWAQAREALLGTTDARLRGTWRLKAGGDVVQQAPRFQMIQDAFNHWAHHRGQMTVYLRLMDVPVPAIYGPSADETSYR